MNVLKSFSYHIITKKINKIIYLILLSIITSLISTKLMNISIEAMVVGYKSVYYMGMGFYGLLGRGLRVIK